MPIPQRIVPVRHGDARGWFTESYSRRRLAELGIADDFVQDNHSFSAARGTLRGLHFQTPPHGQAKLVRCLAGAIWDVAVDLRAGSPTYGKWVGCALTAAGGEQLYVPVGFAHGFFTLTDNVEVAYKTSDYYAPDCDSGVAWDDPDIALAWPLEGLEPMLSDKDRKLPRLADFVSLFAYDGVPMAELD
ncbi:dTDP-4-dehydrorhamnose 3,5-epimerase [Novosphingobium aquae]|uniref:dTDP-4-dehydrorhamnose 3,5-epimerase n=1 Tax=Novosphingobium aquae TaxID=3133435 RepID=A0ABU8S8N4_9SPHN